MGEEVYDGAWTREASVRMDSLGAGPRGGQFAAAVDLGRGEDTGGPLEQHLQLGPPGHEGDDDGDGGGDGLHGDVRHDVQGHVQQTLLSSSLCTVLAHIILSLWSISSLRHFTFSS